MVGESRSELLQWLNSELDLNYTKIEQCGSGAAYCQLMDSIFGGIPMSKVKFDTKLEYDFRSNMKILQVAFNKQNMTKTIEVERLIKCRLQDNLELLQFMRKVWMDNKDVHSVYDPQSRRTSSGSSTQSGVGVGVGVGAPRSRVSSAGLSGNRTASRPSSRTASGNITNGDSPNVRLLPKQRRSTIETNTPPLHNPTTPNNGGSLQRKQELAAAQKQLEQANEELVEYKIQVESMETERNFYFNKLIEIETLIRNITNEENKSILESLTVGGLAEQVQQILYTTEEGFQVAEEMEGIDEETF